MVALEFQFNRAVRIKYSIAQDTALTPVARLNAMAAASFEPPIYTVDEMSSWQAFTNASRSLPAFRPPIRYAGRALHDLFEPQFRAAAAERRVTAVFSDVDAAAAGAGAGEADSSSFGAAEGATDAEGGQPFHAGDRAHAAPVVRLGTGGAFSRRKQDGCRGRPTYVELGFLHRDRLRVGAGNPAVVHGQGQFVPWTRGGASDVTRRGPH